MTSGKPARQRSTKSSKATEFPRARWRNSGSATARYGGVRPAASHALPSVRRPGYRIDHAGHVRQSHALEPFGKKAKTGAPLDPAVKPLSESLADLHEKDAKWKLVINEPVEIDF